MRPRYSLASVLLLTGLFLLIGCGGSTPTPVPPTVPPPTVPPPTATAVPATATPPPTQPPATATTLPSPTGEPSASPTSAATSGPTTAGYDGEWEGQTSTDSTMGFSIENNEVTYININYSIEEGPCQFLSGSRSQGAQNPPITVIEGDAFDARVDFDDGEFITLGGTFSSESQASGTFEVHGNSSSCGEFEEKGTWTATKLAEAESEEESQAEEPTEEATPEEELPTLPAVAPPDANETTTPAADSSTDSSSAETADAGVLQDFFEAVNAGDVETAISYLDENVVFNSGTTAIIGKEDLQTYLEGQISRGETYEISNVQDFGSGALTFSIRIGSGPTNDDSAAVVMQSKIAILTLR